MQYLAVYIIITYSIIFFLKGSFQIAVRIFDEDVFDDDLIDIVVFDRIIIPGSGWVGMENRQGVHNSATVSAEFRVDCNTNFYGSNCATFCVATDNSQGHYTCDSNGGRVCLSGWTNTNGGQNCLTRMLS